MISRTMFGQDLKNIDDIFLRGFKARATDPNTSEHKIIKIFGKSKNKNQSTYNLREIIDRVEEFCFSSLTNKHELSNLFEPKIRNNADSAGQIGYSCARQDG